ncbi:conserved hypothetical protein [Neospora caninum Liverpool]|nr:conserved hypothetical protein [Neospora caninum Liverpool]CBZ53951.1 conserved hypothetical protein [Neospora caninum Liverpool]|eukprot:XP_003883983.1 conserved hypothetical protein [Neospora caninum Liverpool]
MRQTKRLTGLSSLYSHIMSCLSLRVFLLPSVVLVLVALLSSLAPSSLWSASRPQKQVPLYCNKTRDLPLALLDGSPSLTPSSSAAAATEACQPCPAHAVCSNGEMRCLPPYIPVSAQSSLESLFGRFGVPVALLRRLVHLAPRSAPIHEDAALCVEDLAAKETAKRVTEAVVLFLRRKAGEAQCAAFSPALAESSPFAPAPEGECDEAVGAGRPQRTTFGFPKKCEIQGRERRDTFTRKPGKGRAEPEGRKDHAQEQGARDGIPASGHGGKRQRERRGESLSDGRPARAAQSSESATRWEIVQAAGTKDFEDDNVYAYVFNHFLDEEVAERDFSVRVEQTYSFQSLDLVAPAEKSAAARQEQTEALLPLFLREQRRSRGITYTYTYTGRHALRPWSCTLYIAVMYRLAPAVLALFLLLLLSLPLAFWLRRVYLRHKLRELLLSRQEAESSELFTLQRNSLAAAISPGTSSRELSHLLVRSLVTSQAGRCLRWWLQRLARNADEVDTLCHDLLVDKHIRLHTARIGEQNFWWAETGGAPKPAQRESPSQAPNTVSLSAPSGASASVSQDLHSPLFSGAPPAKAAACRLQREMAPRQPPFPTLLEMCGANGPSGGCSSSLGGDGMPAEAEMLAILGDRGQEGWLDERVRRSSAYLSACRLADGLDAETMRGHPGKSGMRRPTLGGSDDAYWREQRGSYLETSTGTLGQRATLLGGGSDAEGSGIDLARNDISSGSEAAPGLKPLPAATGGRKRLSSSLDRGSGTVGRAQQAVGVSGDSRSSVAARVRQSSVVKETAERDYSHAAFFAMANRGRERRHDATRQAETTHARGSGRGGLGFLPGEAAEITRDGRYTGTAQYDQILLPSHERRRSERRRSTGLPRADDDGDHDRGHAVLC